MTLLGALADTCGHFSGLFMRRLRKLINKFIIFNGQMVPAHRIELWTY